MGKGEGDLSPSEWMMLAACSDHETKKETLLSLSRQTFVAAAAEFEVNYSVRFSPK